MNTTRACFAYICINQVWSTDDVNTTLLFKDNFELTRQNDEQTVFPVKNFIGINNNLLLGEKTFRFSCERRHKHAVFAHASLLLKAIKLSQTARLFQSKKKRRYTISTQMADEINLKKKIDIPKHHLPSCSIFPGLIKSISIPRFGLNI